MSSCSGYIKHVDTNKSAGGYDDGFIEVKSYIIKHRFIKQNVTTDNDNDDRIKFTLFDDDRDKFCRLDNKKLRCDLDNSEYASLFEEHSEESRKALMD